MTAFDARFRLVVPVLAAVHLAATLLACSVSTPSPPAGAAPNAAPSEGGPASERDSYRSPLVSSLLDLAGSALAEHDLDVAEGRYRRVIEVDPDCLEARVGLAKIAGLRGDRDAQRAQLEEAVRLDPDGAAALRELALLEADGGDATTARRMLERARRTRPFDPLLLDALARVTGRAPRPPDGASNEAILGAARDHPLDPAARLRAGLVRLSADDREGAVRDLEAALLVADWNPEAALQSASLLHEIDPAWQGRRIVPVHSWADQSMRDDPAWRMRVRVEWRKASLTLDSVLGTVFVPVSIQSFSTARSGPRMAEIRDAWRRSILDTPARGILAGFTFRRPPAPSRDARLGEAELMGRQLVVRLEPGEQQSRVLLHELFHLYGGVHVAQDLDSLMNPTGTSLSLDPVNRQIARTTRDRRFSALGLERDVFDHVETASLIEVYKQALNLNLSVRNAGIERAKEASQDSRYLAADLAAEAIEMDVELAQLARIIGELLAREGLYANASRYCDLAARLHGDDRIAAAQSRARSEQFRSRGRAPGP